MRRPPPRSTLFPYTTLFRSTIDDEIAQATTLPLYPIPPSVNVQPTLSESLLAPSGELPFGDLPSAMELPHKASQDRKSTRLNSSHLGISYAVFCLKKKINSNPTPSYGSSLKRLFKRGMLRTQAAGFESSGCEPAPQRVGPAKQDNTARGRDTYSR